jgi:MarR family transcriptional regulator, organic hydroperoxide resistance regulator
MKSKPELISEVIEIFKTLEQNRLHYQFEPWRKLDVPLAQLKSLFLIHIKGSVSVRDLALDLAVTPGNVTSIVDRLVGQGLVHRAENPEDRRVVLLQLTDKGRKTINEIHETGHAHMKRFIERMSSQDLTALVRGIRAFLAAIHEDHQELTSNQNVSNRNADISFQPPARSSHRHVVKPA